MGIPIEQSNPEYAAGQVEVNLRYGSALEAADRVIMFRSLVKQLAAAHGYLATFMAKPFFDQSGNGFHVHHSLWKDGKNQFADNGKLSKLGLQYLAGMQKRMAETALCGATTPNAFRRRQPYTFCPVNTAWGMDNRTVGLRVLEGSDSAVRVEKRDGSADCNPYFLIASEIAAGLDGIEQKLEPTAMTAGNAYEEADAEAIPADIETAVAAANNSDFEFFSQQITPVETDRYLRNL